MSQYLEMSAKMRFLIIDNVSSNVEAMKVSLKKMGYSNFVAQSSGYDAIRYLKKNPVDFILCRLQLPVMNGVELLSEMKADYAINRVPFTMFSEEIDEADLALLTEHGVDAHLTLPFVTKSLAEKVAATWSRYIDPNNVEYHFEAARKLFLAAKYPEAEKVYNSILQSGKIKSRAKVAIARIALKQGNLERATELAREITEEFESDVHGFQLKGEIHLRKNELIEAIKSFTRAIEISPKNPYRYEVVGDILLGIQMWDEAEKMYKLALSHELVFQPILEGLSAALVNANKKQEAINYFKKLIELAPKEVKYLNNVAVCFKALGNLDGAIEYYKKAIEVDPKNSKVLYNLGLVYFEKGVTSAAKNQFRQALELEPTNEKIRLKILQIDDPETYALKIKQAAAQATKVNTTEDLIDKDRSEYKLTKLSQDELQKLDGLIAGIKAPAASAQKQVVVPSLNLDVEIQKKISALKDVQLKYQYFMSLRQLRERFAGIMSNWFDSIIAISTECSELMISVCLQTLEDAQIPSATLNAISQASTSGASNVAQMLQSAAQKNSTIHEKLTPFMMELQFQDHACQSLRVIQKCFSSALDNIGPDIGEKLQGFCVSQEERQLVARTYEQFAGKIPQRPSATPAKEDIPLKVSHLEVDYAYWRMLNAVLIKQVAHIIARMEAANTKLTQHIELAMKQSIEADDIRKKISGVIDSGLRSRASEGIENLQKVMESQNNIDSSLKALLGNTRYSILLQKRLAVFKEIAEIFANLHLDIAGPTQIKEKLLALGPNLSYIWMHCLARCRSAEERELLKDGIKPKQDAA